MISIIHFQFTLSCRRNVHLNTKISYRQFGRQFSNPEYKSPDRKKYFAPRPTSPEAPISEEIIAELPDFIFKSGVRKEMISLAIF